MPGPGVTLVGDTAPLPTVAAEGIAQHAATRGFDFLGTPYLWGGSTPFGLDCSGFTQLCYRLAGMTLRRDARLQRNDPRFVDAPFDSLEPGDLIFFGSGPEKITHVGVANGDGTFLHAAGGAGVIPTTIAGDDRYWPRRVDARRLDPTRAHEPVSRPDDESSQTP